MNKGSLASKSVIGTGISATKQQQPGLFNAMRIVNDHPDIEAQDLRDVQRGGDKNRTRRLILTLATIVLIPVFLLLLVLGSLPALTPQEIVQMEGYQGRQKAKPIFNLASVTDNQPLPVHPVSVQQPTDVEVPVAGGTPVSLAIPTKGQAPGPAQAELNEAPITGLLPVVGEQRKSKNAAAAATPVAATITSVPVDLKSAAGATELQVVEAVDKSTPVAFARKLPVLEVKKERSNVRDGPDLDAEVLTTLSRGTSVTVFDRTGEWLQIGVNEGNTAVMGFIHKSLLGLTRR